MPGGDAEADGPGRRGGGGAPARPEKPAGAKKGGGGERAALGKHAREPPEAAEAAEAKRLDARPPPPLAPKPKRSRTPEPDASAAAKDSTAASGAAPSVSQPHRGEDAAAASSAGKPPPPPAQKRADDAAPAKRPATPPSAQAKRRPPAANEATGKGQRKGSGRGGPAAGGAEPAVRAAKAPAPPSPQAPRSAEGARAPAPAAPASDALLLQLLTGSYAYEGLPKSCHVGSASQEELLERCDALYAKARQLKHGVDRDRTESKGTFTPSSFKQAIKAALKFMECVVVRKALRASVVRGTPHESRLPEALLLGTRDLLQCWSAALRRQQGGNRAAPLDSWDPQLLALWILAERISAVLQLWYLYQGQTDIVSKLDKLLEERSRVAAAAGESFQRPSPDSAASSHTISPDSANSKPPVGAPQGGKPAGVRPTAQQVEAEKVCKERRAKSLEDEKRWGRQTLGNTFESLKAMRASTRNLPEYVKLAVEAGTDGKLAEAVAVRIGLTGSEMGLWDVPVIIKLAEDALAAIQAAHGEPRRAHAP